MNDLIGWVAAIGLAVVIAYYNHRARIAQWDAFLSARRERSTRCAAEMMKLMK